MGEVTKDSIIKELRLARQIALQQKDRKAFKAATKAMESVGWQGQIYPEDNEHLDQEIALDCVDTALYRHFDKNGQLLYVGVSIQTLLRLMAHRRNSPWFREIARVDIQWYKSKSGAYYAEKRAIQTERPLWNKAHNPCLNSKTLVGKDLPAPLF